MKKYTVTIETDFDSQELASFTNKKTALKFASNKKNSAFTDYYKAYENPYITVNTEGTTIYRQPVLKIKN